MKWSTSAGAKPEKSFAASNYKVTAKVSVYPIIKNYTITWDASEGTIDGKTSYEQSNLYYGERLYSYGFPVRSGYIFVGWSTTTSKKNLVDFNNTYVTKDATYHAIWEKNAYEITIKSGGGAFSYVGGGAALSSDRTTITAYLEKGKPLSSLPSFSGTKDGNSLEALAASENGAAIADPGRYYPAGDMTLYAVPATVTVTYNAKGGTRYEGSNETTWTKKYAKGESLIYYSAYRKGYVLKGWYTKAKGGEEVTAVTNDMTVYAQWTKGCTVTFDANGGRYSTYSYITKRAVTVAKNTVLDDYYSYASYYQPYSTDNNKGFAGWSKSKEGEAIDISKLKITKNTTLYAVWKKGDDLADGRIELADGHYSYTGKAVKPKFTVYDRNGNKLKSSQYTATWYNNVLPTSGYAYLKVTGKGKYAGSQTAYFKINYEKTSNVKSVTGSKKNLKVKYTKAAGATVYSVYAVNKSTGKVYSTTSRTLSASIKNLASGTYNVYVLPGMEVKEGTDKILYTFITDKAGKVKSKKV